MLIYMRPLVDAQRFRVRYQDEWSPLPTLVLWYLTTEAKGGIEVLSVRPTSPLILHNALTLSFNRTGTGPHPVINRSIKGYPSKFFFRFPSACFDPASRIIQSGQSTNLPILRLFMSTVTSSLATTWDRSQSRNRRRSPCQIKGENE